MNEPKNSRLRFSLRAFIALVVISSLCLALATGRKRITELEAMVRSLRASPIDLLHFATYVERNAVIGANQFFPTKIAYDRSADSFVLHGDLYINHGMVTRHGLVFRRKADTYVGELSEKSIERKDSRSVTRIRPTGRTHQITVPLDLPNQFPLGTGWKPKEVSITRDGRRPNLLPIPRNPATALAR